jgi:hypothetical protein
VLLKDLFIRVESPGDVSLFVYDNNTFIVESFLPESVNVRISLDPRFAKIREITTEQEYAGKTMGAAGGFGMGGAKRMIYPVQIKPHSYRVFAATDN